MSANRHPTELKYLEVPAEFKTTGSAGRFEGYASVFGNVDLGGDVIERGAFKTIHANDEGNVVVLWQHGVRDPIGVAKVIQDAKGLRFTGQLVLEDATARKAHAHMKAKSVRGMSIGFDILPGGAKVLESGVRLLTALELWEISVVTFGMNPAAGVDAIKAAAECATPRQLEDLLREKLFLTRRKAVPAALALWPILNERDAQDDEDERDARNRDRDDRSAAKAATAGKLSAITRELRTLNDQVKEP